VFGEAAGPPEDEAGALGGGGLDADVSAMAAEDVLDGPETHAVALLAFGADAEGKEGGKDGERDSGTLVGDDDFDAVVVGGEGDGDLGVGVGAGFAGVADEVEQDLADFAGESVDGEVGAFGFSADFDDEAQLALGEQTDEEGFDGFGGGEQVDGFGNAGLAEEGQRGAADGDDALGFGLGCRG
jgi:hypothetical protein